MLVVKKICKNFRDRAVINDVSLTLDRGDYICLKGPSGSGKTTLLNIIADMLTPDSGFVTLDRVPVASIIGYRQHYIGYLPCGNCLLDSLTVAENIMFASGCTRQQAEELLEQFKILGIADGYPREISSGEYKRVCFARVLAMNTPYLLLDEPTSNLDEESAAIIIDAISKSDKGIIVSTHDPRLMRGKIFAL